MPLQDEALLNERGMTTDRALARRRLCFALGVKYAVRAEEVTAAVRSRRSTNWRILGN
jgi:hypothetical protein